MCKRLEVFPAHAGMSLVDWTSIDMFSCFPRSRGDEPQYLGVTKTEKVFSPLTRG